MQLRCELQANITSIKLKIEEEKQRAKDLVNDESAAQTIQELLSELHVRLNELEHNLRML